MKLKIYKSNKNSSLAKGQLSLEYLVLLAISFSMLAIFISAASNFLDKSEISLEKQKAKHFSETFNQAISELTLFGSGSAKQIQLYNKFQWAILINSQEISINILAKGQETINVTAKINESADIEETEIICTDCGLLLSKNSGHFSVSISNKQ